MGDYGLQGTKVIALLVYGLPLDSPKLQVLTPVLFISLPPRLQPGQGNCLAALGTVLPSITS